MRSTVPFLFLFCTCFTYIHGAVTNEDIRVAILQIVNVVRSTDDKLERHEYRDRVVGEQLKKGMVNIDKRIKMLDPLKGTVSRLDERLAAVETILMQKDERERIQLQKTYDVVMDIQKNLPLIVEQLKNEIIGKLSCEEPPAQITEPMMTRKDFEKMEKQVLNKIDRVSNTIDNMEKELVNIKEENGNINILNNKSSENFDKVKRQLDNSEQLLAKYQNKLAEYNNKIPQVVEPASFKEQDEWKTNLQHALDTQKSQVKEVLNDIKLVRVQIDSLPNKNDIETVGNSTMHKLEEIKQDAVQIPSRSAKLLENSFKEIHEDADRKQKELGKSVNQLSEITSSLTESFSTNYDKIIKEIQALAKMEQVMMQTADNVLDTKRRVEYGVHQILAEVSKQIKDSSKDINQGISDRFDNFELSILDEETGALANLTSKIGEEIDQVWRQIGIMHQQMSASTDTLNKLQNQTDAYVNGSLDVMDNMKGKVGQITGRMSEVDENLNYLLGRLSLVTQEFNQIKSGLGTALDQIRSSFQTVQDKIKNAGPGPHKISSNEVVDVDSQK